MTHTPLTATTKELQARLDRLKQRIADNDRQIDRLDERREMLCEAVCEVLGIINRRESCPHEDFTENLEGRTCRTCGLETK